MKVINYHISYGFQKDTQSIFKGSGYADTFVRSNTGELKPADIQPIRESLAKQMGVETNQIVIFAFTKMNEEEIPDEKWEKGVF